MEPNAGASRSQEQHHEAAAAEGLTPSQQIALRDEVQKLLDREHKMLRFYGAAALGILAVLGITTCQDIKSQTTEIVKSDVEGLINRADSETGVRQTLDGLVGRSVMTASLIALRRPETTPFDKRITVRTRMRDRELNLSFDDWTRLKKWIKDEKVDLQDFSGTLVVLAAQDEERVRQDSRDFLGEMLNPPAESQFKWMRNQPAKRLAILQNFLRPGLESPAFAIATSAESSRELRLAALDYIGTVHYKDRFDELLSLASPEGADGLALRALVICASLDPLDPQIKQETDKILNEPATPSRVDKAIRLAAAIWYAPSSTNDKVADTIKDKIREGRQEIAKKLLSYAFDHHSRVVVLDGGIIAIFPPSEDGPNDQSFGVEKGIFKDFNPYWNLLKDAAAGHDVTRIS
jgi:hypothetical protein